MMSTKNKLVEVEEGKTYFMPIVIRDVDGPGEFYSRRKSMSKEIESFSERLGCKLVPAFFNERNELVGIQPIDEEEAEKLMEGG